jgi:hypothetical protein
MAALMSARILDMTSADGIHSVRPASISATRRAKFFVPGFGDGFRRVFWHAFQTDDEAADECAPFLRGRGMPYQTASKKFIAA